MFQSHEHLAEWMVKKQEENNIGDGMRYSVYPACHEHAKDTVGRHVANQG